MTITKKEETQNGGSSSEGLSEPGADGGGELLLPLRSPPIWTSFQRVVSGLALVALAPLFAVLWCLVKATSPGPFLVRNRREGLLGIPINFYKIRTVREAEPYAVVRQTPVGTMLRTLKLDELPQLWNVLRGDLLWVGPRPLPISVADRLRSSIPRYSERLRVVPGLTNLGSISTMYDESQARSEPDFEALVEADLHYLENRSVVYDMTTLFMTFCYVVRRALAPIFRTSSGQLKAGVTAVDDVTLELQTWLASTESNLSTRQSSKLWSLTQRLAALLGMIVAAPLFAMMYVGVKLTSPGPFLFCQMRRGFMGTPFRIYKVRTLSVGSEKRTALGVQNNDPTVTRFGKMLRALKFDELPQLYNVVRGDMELVGPRPIPMALENKLLEHIPDFGHRHLVRPGLTNVGQVSVMDNELDDRLIADWTIRAESERHYVAHKGLAYDIVMVVLTSLFIARKFFHRTPAEPAAPDGPTVTQVIGTPIVNLGYDGIVDLFRGWIEAGSPHRTVNICPVHSLVEAKLNPEHRRSLEKADLNTADGMPVVWAKRVLGNSDSSRVYGPTLMLKALAAAEEAKWRVGIFGGHPERLDLLTENLLRRFPDLNVAFCESPPFRPLDEEEESDLCERMNEANLDLVWVGLGCPKQEAWMRDHRDKIQGIFVGVGAAFDFHAGKLRQAPSWMQVVGMEWFFRLCCEPKRLVGRYAKTNPTFIILFALQLIRSVFRRGSNFGPLDLSAPGNDLPNRTDSSAPKSLSKAA